MTHCIGTSNFLCPTCKAQWLVQVFNADGTTQYSANPGCQHTIADSQFIALVTLNFQPIRPIVPNRFNSTH